MSSQYAVIISESSGIGPTTANQLVEQGFQVTIVARGENKLKATNDSLNGAASALSVDATNPDRVRKVLPRRADVCQIAGHLASSLLSGHRV